MGAIIRNGIVYGSTTPVDDNLSNTSVNPVQNKVVTEELNKIKTETLDELEFKIDKEDIVECTRAKYEAMDESKLTDNKLYFITDHTYNYNDDITPPIVYGYHIKANVTDSYDAVEYIDIDKNVVTDLTPAYMDFTNDRFEYGSWEHAFFMPRPCMVNRIGYVDYYLDPRDYTKKLDETPSDVANESYNGNAMMEWGKLWYKYEAGTTDGEGYFWVSDKQIDDDFHCWCNINSINREIEHFYTAIYNGTGRSGGNTKLRSISGLTVNEMQSSTDVDVACAERNNLANERKEWYIDVFSDRVLINSLLVLMGKSLDTQAVFGAGLTSGNQSTSDGYVTGTLNDKGLFWGTDSGTDAVKVFGMENWWSCKLRKIAGCVSVNGSTTGNIKIKLTYNNADGSGAASYNFTGEGFIDTGINLSINEEWITKMKYADWGYFPCEQSSTEANSPYKDYHNGCGSSGVDKTTMLMSGGCPDTGAQKSHSGAFRAHTKRVASNTNWYGFGVALSYKPIS